MVVSNHIDKTWGEIAQKLGGFEPHIRLGPHPYQKRVRGGRFEAQDKRFSWKSA